MLSVDITVSFILRFLLVFIFLRGALHKVGNHRHFCQQLEAYQLLPRALIPAFSFFAALVEGYLACTMLMPGWIYPSCIATALLTLYALAMCINLAKGRIDMDCGCSGPSGVSQTISWALVARNIVLAFFALTTALPMTSRSVTIQDISTILLASMAVILMYCSVEQAIVNRQRQRQYYALKAGIKPGTRFMSAMAISQSILWLVVVVLCVVVFALMRQIGILHERVYPAGALMTGRGPQTGDPVPVDHLIAFDESRITLGDGQRSTLLLFVSPTCPVCKTLLPIVNSLARAEANNHPLQVILASDGDTADDRQLHLKFINAHKLDKKRYVISKLLGLAFMVEKLPFATLIDNAGVIRAKGLVNSREHLESLFEAHERGVASLQEFLASD